MRFFATLTVIFVGVLACAAVPSAQAGQRCPGTVVIAARGTLEPNAGAQTYGGGFGSNGWEGFYVGNFLRYAAGRYRALHGAELFADAKVVGLDASVYPALQTTMRAQADLRGKDLGGIVSYLREQSSRDPREAGAYQQSAYLEQVPAVQRAVLGIDGPGCRPQYVLVGYSQGAMMLRNVEKVLESTGRLRGAFYFGNPIVQAGDASYVGDSARSGGTLAAYPGEGRSATVERMEYCRAGDVVCDAHGAPGMAHLKYFLPGSAETAWGRAIADRFAGWLTSPDSGNNGSNSGGAYAVQ